MNISNTSPVLIICAKRFPCPYHYLEDFCRTKSMRKLNHKHPSRRLLFSGAAVLNFYPPGKITVTVLLNFIWITLFSMTLVLILLLVTLSFKSIFSFPSKDFSCFIFIIKTKAWWKTNLTCQCWGFSAFVQTSVAFLVFYLSQRNAYKLVFNYSIRWIEPFFLPCEHKK